MTERVKMLGHLAIFWVVGLLVMSLCAFGFFELVKLTGDVFYAVIVVVAFVFVSVFAVLIGGAVISFFLEND